MVKNPGDGIYLTRSHRGSDVTHWPDHRKVYIQGNVVRLVDYIAYGETEYKIDLFNFGHFFKVNELGKRISDLPENFDIHATK